MGLLGRKRSIYNINFGKDQSLTSYNSGSEADFAFFGSWDRAFASHDRLPNSFYHEGIHYRHFGPKIVIENGNQRAA